MLKDFRINWGNCYSAVVVHISHITMTILDEGNNRSKAELSREVSMAQHAVYKMLKHIKECQGRIKKMLRTDLIIINTFSLFQAKCSIQYLIHSTMQGWETGFSLFSGFSRFFPVFFNGKKFFFLIFKKKV